MGCLARKQNMGNNAQRLLLVNSAELNYVLDFVLISYRSLIRRDNSPYLILDSYNMSANTSSANSMAVLSERLKKAEKRLNLLTCEISSIKSELLDLQQNSGTTSRQYSTTTSPTTDTDGANHSDPKKARYGFVKENDYVVVYTDGACENNGRANAKAGIGVWFGGNHPLNVSQPVNGRATNNTAEIQACISAVTIAHKNGVTKLKIKTDSQFVINSMTQWIHRWKKNNWKVAGGGDVKNKEDFVKLDHAITLLDSVSWEHVDGHKGIIGNEEADRLARGGAVLYK